MAIVRSIPQKGPRAGSSGERNEHRGGPDLRVVDLPSMKVDGPKAMRSVHRGDLDGARDVARRDRVAYALDRNEQLGAAQLPTHRPGAKQLCSRDFPIEVRTVDERIPLERVSHLDVSIDPSRQPD